MTLEHYQESNLCLTRMLIRTFPVLMLHRSNRHTWLHLLELTMEHPALALRLLMLISSVPNPLTAMMADNGIMAISQISKTRTLTALGRKWATHCNYRMAPLLS